MTGEDSGQEPLEGSDTVHLVEWARDLTYDEVHLFIEGLYRGLVRLDPRPEKKLGGTVLADSWYYKGGFVLGYLLKAAVVGSAGVGAKNLLSGLP
jgi:hypothetical protein